MIEIQADRGEPIALDKARQAFRKFQSPVAVTDDSWLIPGLNGFPGPYMRYINQWLQPEDFLKLTASLKDRRIFMRHIIAYKNFSEEKVFAVDIPGTLLKSVRGSAEIPHFAVISMDGGKLSVAEAESDSDTTVIAKRPNAWHEIGKWLTNDQA